LLLRPCLQLRCRYLHVRQQNRVAELFNPPLCACFACAQP